MKINKVLVFILSLNLYACASSTDMCIKNLNIVRTAEDYVYENIPEVGKEAPNFQLNEDLNFYRKTGNKYSLLLFWSTSCHRCHNILELMHNNKFSDDFYIFTVVESELSDIEDMELYFPTYIDDGIILAKYNGNFFPYLLLIDHNKKIRASVIGESNIITPFKQIKTNMEDKEGLKEIEKQIISANNCRLLLFDRDSFCEDNFYYIYLANRRLYAVTNRATIALHYIPLNEVFNRFKGKLIYADRSFLVNPAYIKNIVNGIIYFTDNKTLRIASSRLDKFLKSYESFLNSN